MPASGTRFRRRGGAGSLTRAPVRLPQAASMHMNEPIAGAADHDDRGHGPQDKYWHDRLLHFTEGQQTVLPLVPG